MDSEESPISRATVCGSPGYVGKKHQSLLQLLDANPIHLSAPEVLQRKDHGAPVDIWAVGYVMGNRDWDYNKKI